MVMAIAWLAFRGLGASGRMTSAATTAGALRYALAVMFLFTAVSHFLPRTRPDMIRMVPPVMPVPELMVTATGVLELAGAVGLLVPATATWAAYCLAALLVAMFPANVYAAGAGLEIGGQAVMALLWRLPLQVLWIAALLWVGREHRRARLAPALPSGA